MRTYHLLENHCVLLHYPWVDPDFWQGWWTLFSLKTLKANTTISDCPQFKPLKMSTVHVNSRSLFSSAFHSGTCWLGISFMCQSKMIFSACQKTLIKLWPQSTSFEITLMFIVMSYQWPHQLWHLVSVWCLSQCSARCLGAGVFLVS